MVIVGLYQLLIIPLALVSWIIGLIILYFVVKHAVRAGVAEAMREVLREFKLAREKEEE